VKEFLAMHHVEFEERSLQETQHLEELGDLYGAYSAPSVIVNGELVPGGLPEIAEAVGVEL
jgi:protein-disulfide isomerase